MKTIEKNYKKTLIYMATVYFLIMGTVGTVNFIMDSYWAFDHENRFNQMQSGSNERQQKTNYVYFHKFDYDAILLGSSRTTLIDQNDFEGIKTFNYAVSMMLPKEFNDYIEFAKKQNGRDFKYIILALDFFATNKLKKAENPKPIIDNTTSFLYRYKLLFSIDALKNSAANIRRFITGKKYRRSYNRHNVASTDILDEKTARRIIESRKHWEEKYKYDDHYIDTLKELQKNNPNSKFIVFTTPVSSFLFNLMLNEGHLKDYERWLRELVMTFGKVTNFMTENSVTTDYTKNYVDTNHFYPRIGKLIAHKVLGINDPKIPKDFGDVLTKENIDDYINSINNRYIEGLAHENLGIKKKSKNN